MITANDFWLRGQAAQRDMMSVAQYNSAFIGTAFLQAVRMGISAPGAFWSAMARAGQAQERLAHTPSQPEPETASMPDLHVPDLPVDEQHAGAGVVQMDPQMEAKPLGPVPQDAPQGGTPDDLTALTGVGPKLAQGLNAAGIYRYDQIASLTEADLDELAAQLKGFAMLAARHDFVEQAKAQTRQKTGTPA